MAEKDNIRISVFIPVKNGVGWIEQCLQGIMQQTLFHLTEIVIVDSGSTDNTLQVLKDYPVRVYSIPPQQFNHGTTRNLALEYCSGDYIVMTVQDAKPFSNTWLEELLSGFSAGENIAGVCGTQVVPHDIDKNPVDWYRPQSAGKIQTYHFDDAQQFDALSSTDKKRVCSWDDVTAMYDKTILAAFPFEATVYGEDAIWAKTVIRKGYTLVYNPNAKVYHYHLENKEYTFKRALTVYYSRYRLFGLIYDKPQKSIVDVLRIVKTIWETKGIGLPAKLRWMRYNMDQQQMLQKAHKVFTDALAISEHELDAVHQKYCNKPPMPVKQTAGLEAA